MTENAKKKITPQADVTDPIPKNGEDLRAVSERPFGLSPKSLRQNQERAPLVHVFERAALEERARQPLWHREPVLGPKAFAAECGVFQGHSMVACLEIANRLGLRMSIVGLDTFVGLPPLSAMDEELAPLQASYRDRTPFTKTSVESVEQRLAHVTSRRCHFELVQGLFKNTLPTLAECDYFFVNIDCDLYEPHLECLAYFYPRMRKGGIIFFDDYHSAEFPMARRAIDEFLADKPETLWHLRLGEDVSNVTKTFVIKE